MPVRADRRLEIEGIAEGSGLPAADVLAINARTEIMWAATAREAASQRALPAASCGSWPPRPESGPMTAVPAGG